MISPGSLPRYGRVRVRTLVYTRARRRRRKQRAAVPAGPREPRRELAICPVVFDHGPAEFPLALLRPREARGRVIAALGALQRWLAARWAWLRPRTLPVLVATVGLLAISSAASYLMSFDQPAPATHVLVHIR